MLKAPFEWQLGLWQHLKQWSSAACPHALLFAGDKGVGGQNLMDVFCQALVCTSPQAPCLSCQNCRLAEENTHPMVHRLGFEEEQSVIGVDEIRALAPVLSLKSTVMRVVLLNANKLNVASSNALLKILEEPNEQICFLLLADKTSMLAPTIVSRCVVLNMPIPTQAQGESFLKSEGLSEQEAAMAMQMFEGEPLRALQHFQAENAAHRQQMMHDCFDLIKGTALVPQIADNWAKGDMQEALYLSYSLIADLCMLRVNAPKTSLKNQDVLDEITDSIQGVTTHQLFGLMESWKKAQKALKANTKAQYALYPLLFGLSDLKARSV